MDHAGADVGEQRASSDDGHGQAPDGRDGDGTPGRLLDELLAVADEAAHAGAETAVRWLERRDDLVVEHKTGPGDLVSQADRETERAVREVLRRHRPADAFLGEEGGAEQGHGAPPDGGRTSDVVWVVDPIDGTTNYLYGLDCWAVSVAAVRSEGPAAYGDVLAAVVVEPVTGRTTSARAGGGTRCNGRPTGVRAGDELSGALVEVGFGHGVDRRFAGPMVGLLDARVRDVRRGGSAVSALAMVATGRADAYWGPTVKVWDVAAGLLLVREAGGVVGDLAGAVPTGLPPSSSVLAAAPGLFEPLRALLAPVYAG